MKNLIIALSVILVSCTFASDKKETPMNWKCEGEYYNCVGVDEMVFAFYPTDEFKRAEFKSDLLSKGKTEFVLTCRDGKLGLAEFPQPFGKTCLEVQEFLRARHLK